MAPPPDSAAEVRSPCWRRAIHRTKGRAGAASAQARPANRSQDRQAISRFSSQAGTQARPTVLLHRPQGGGLSPIIPLSTTPCDRHPIGLSPHTPCRIGVNSLGLAGVRSCAHISLLCVLAAIKAVPGYPFLDPAPPGCHGRTAFGLRMPAPRKAASGFRRPPPLTLLHGLSGSLAGYVRASCWDR